MKRWTRPVVILTAAATLTAAGSYVAYASWFVPSKQIQVKIKSATMPRGATPTATSYGGGAIVSWRAQEVAPGARMQSYLVTAHSAEQPPAPNVTRTVTATGAATESTLYTVGDLGGGEWYWTLAPKFQSWVGKESRESDKLLTAVDTNPPIHDWPASPLPTAAAPPTVTAIPIPEQSASPSATAPKPSESAITVLPTPLDTPEPLPPPSSFNPGPPPPLAF